MQRVEVSLTVEDGAPHALVVRRLAESIGTAAERLLIGRDSDVVARQESALAGVLREVVDRVIRGYRVTALGFQAGATTTVIVRVQPRPPILGDVPIVTTFTGIHADAQAFVRENLEPAMPELRRLLFGLPVEALEWAGPIIERRTTELIEGAATGLTAVGRIETAPAPRFVVTVTARDARVVRDVGVRFRSSSIPYVLLDQHTPQVVSMAELLRGLPVVFVAAHRARFESIIAARLAAYPPVREYGVIARPVLQVAEVTLITVLADSTLYRGRIEARLNIGTQAPPPDIRAQLGRAFGGVEPFVELTLFPSTLAFRWAVGLRIEAGSDVTVGIKAQLTGEDQETFLTYRLSPDLTVRGAYFLQTGALEGTLTFRLNEFLSWEGVATSRGAIWLRVVSNL
ncbi:MAG: hypothetical protein ACT4PY_13535 [Armatimonadota bacterium]